MQEYYQSQLGIQEAQNQQIQQNNNQNGFSINNSNNVNNINRSSVLDGLCDFFSEIVDCFSDCFQAFKTNCIPDGSCKVEDLKECNCYACCIGCDCNGCSDCNGCDCNGCDGSCHNCSCDGGCDLNGCDCPISCL